MRPATRYVVRSTGCGQFLGAVLIFVGVVVLVANTGLGMGYSRLWPIIVIAAGLLLLIRHYWNQYHNRPGAQQLLDGGLIPRLGSGRFNWSPPGIPMLIIAFGVWRLVVNLHWARTWVLVAIALILIGVLFLGGSIRASFSRT
jgi:hypothetical protein